MKKILNILFLILFGLFGVVENGYGNEVVCILSNSNIVDAGTPTTGYTSWNFTDECSQTWNAYCIKNKHSNADAAYNFIQIKAYKSSVAYYLEVPQKTGYVIKSISLNVSADAKPHNGGLNSATLYFSASNNSNTASNGLSVNPKTTVSGTGTSFITLDCEILGLTTGYITSSSVIRLWGDITVTYTSSMPPTPTTYDTIAFRDIHNNKWTLKTTENNDTIFLHDTVPSEACRLNGWVFAGWSTDSLDETKIIKDSSYIIPTKNDTLYAFYRLDSLKSCYRLVENNLDDWNGEYLIVSEDSIAFDGGLTTLDAVCDTIRVKVSNKLIPISVKTESSKFTITKKSDGYSILSASKMYIGKTSDSNGLDNNASDIYTNTISFDNGITNIIGSGGAHLRYNAASDQNRFRYYRTSTYTGQKPIQLYKKQSGTSEYLTNPQCFETNISVAEWFEDKVEFDIGNYESVYTYNDQMKSCDSIRIRITQDGKDCIRWFQVPIFAGSHTSKNDCNCDVVILSDSVLTVTDNIESANVTIYPGGILEVGTPSGNVHKTYTMKSLTLRRDNDSVPQLLLRNDGFLYVKTKMFFEMRTDGEDYRWLTLPDTFRTSVVNEPEEVVVKYYDGDYRAKNGRGGWKEEWTKENGKNYTKKFAPGEGCIFGIISDKKQIYKIELDTNILKLEKTRKYVRIHPYFHKDKPKNDLGWNLVGNPFMTTDTVSTNFGVAFKTDSLVRELDEYDNWTGRWDTIPGAQKLRYIVVPRFDSDDPEIIAAGGYEQICLQNGYKLKPFTSFFIQVKQGYDTLYFYHGSRVADVKKISKKLQNNETFLQLQVGSIKTGCYISNKFNDDYEIGDDLESLYQTYQLINGYKLIYSAINDSIINAGIHIYTSSGSLRLDEKTDVNEFEEINALYNGNWYDLLHGETVDVSGEFILQARRKQYDITTDIDNITTSTYIQKFIYNGKVFIMKNNRIFTVLGEIVK